MKNPIYNKEGKTVGEIELPEEIFGLKWNADLVSQVVNSMNTARRKGTAHVKNRGEVRGSGIKPWKQKGTGRARHGSRRSPIWVGGGVTHGPRNDQNYDRKINKKTKAKALHTILSAKLKDKEIIFVDSLNLIEPKTKLAKEIISNLSEASGEKMLVSKRKNSALIAISQKDQKIEKSFANFGNMKVDEFRNLNPVDILNYKYLLIEAPESAITFLKKKFTKKHAE